MESFTVKFWIKKPDGYWEQRKETFTGKTKDSHDEAKKAWLDKYRNNTVELMSVSYQ